MAGRCGRGVRIYGVATRCGWKHSRGGRRKLRRESGDPVGAASRGSEVAGAAVRERRSRWTGISAQIAKIAGAAFRGGRRWRRSRVDEVAVCPVGESGEQVCGVSEWRARRKHIFGAQEPPGDNRGLVRADAGENTGERTVESGAARRTFRDIGIDRFAGGRGKGRATTGSRAKNGSAGEAFRRSAGEHDRL